MIATTLNSLLNIQLSPYNPIIYNESSIIIFSDPEDIAPPKLVRHLPLLQICLKYMYSTPYLPHPPLPPPNLAWVLFSVSLRTTEVPTRNFYHLGAMQKWWMRVAPLFTHTFAVVFLFFFHHNDCCYKQKGWETAARLTTVGSCNSHHLQELLEGPGVEAIYMQTRRDILLVLQHTFPTHKI